MMNSDIDLQNRAIPSESFTNPTPKSFDLLPNQFPF